MTSIQTARLIHTFTRHIVSDFQSGAKHFPSPSRKLQCRIRSGSCTAKNWSFYNDEFQQRWRTWIYDCAYSQRKAIIGSTRVARRAGM